MMAQQSYKSLDMTQFREKWSSLNPAPFHASNPQPFTIREFGDLIGKTNLLNINKELELGYCPPQGTERLRGAISRLYEWCEPDKILTCSSAQEAIYISMHALLSANDTVVAFSPVFEPLIATAEQIGCEVKLLPLDPKRDWQPDLDVLRDTLTDNVRMLIINFPHNPTGAMIDEDTLETIIEECSQHGIWLLSDEVFRGLEYTPDLRLPAVADQYDQGISLGVLSKAFALPAYRVGWIASEDITFLERCQEIKNYLSICNSLIAELFAAEAIFHATKIFQRNRELLVSNLGLLRRFMDAYEDNFIFIPPRAGCTAFVGLYENSTSFAERFIKQKKLLVLPHSGFRTDFNAVRLGFGNRNFFEKLLKLSEFVDEEQSFINYNDLH